MIDFELKDGIDIFLLACFLYYTYQLMRASNAATIFSGILLFVFVWLVVSQVLSMRLLGTFLDKIVNVGLLALIILFKKEIRMFFASIGRYQRLRAFLRLFSSRENAAVNDDVMPIVFACMNMSRQKTGALLVIEHAIKLTDITDSGEHIEARVSQRLIENLFFKNSPLHDGAMVIADHKIVATACLLPVSRDATIPKHLGLRHRAALGIAQASDALAIVVSEETGGISVAYDGTLYTGQTAETLEQLLTMDRTEYAKFATT